MRWFRSNRHLARLALIAVALQLVLTFAHLHLPPLAQAGAVQALSATAGELGDPDSSGGGRNGRADLDCPICALIQMSAAATPSLAPALPLPAAVAFVTLRPHAHPMPAAAPRISQRARAPPAAARA
jgi:hypothetical protein